MKKCNLKENSNITTQQIEQAVYQLRGSHSYSSASYTLTDTPEGYHLNFLLEEKYEKRINLGIRFDSEEIASLLINATADLNSYSFPIIPDRPIRKAICRPHRLHTRTDAATQFQFLIYVSI